MNEKSPIRIAAALITNEDGRVLLVRKQGSKYLIQPGGKIEAHEEPLSALRRELFEELGVEIVSGSDRYVGQFSAPAVHENGHIVIAEVFAVSVAGGISPKAEIAEFVWVDPAACDEFDVAPLTKHQIFRHLIPSLPPAA